jgi:Fe2+ or Zn2+ uptake regulation protein
VLRVVVPKHPLFSISQEFAEKTEKTEKTEKGEDGRSTQAHQRRERILEILRDHAPADLAMNDLQKLIGASLATTYRDIDALREQGLVRPTTRGRLAISEPR